MPPELDYPTMSSDIILKGSLRKAKNWNKRFFVLRDGLPPKLEYYESERKWKNNKPKKRINLEKPWNIDKKKDTKHDFLIVIFTEDDYFSMAADSSETQDQWVNALQRTVRPEPGWLLFKHMWHVVLDNRELECTKPVVLENKDLESSKSNASIHLHGPHRVCLTHDQMVFVHASSNGGGDRSKGKPIEILLNSIRVCGHKEGRFFIEPGRASGIGNGKLWMDLNDEVMASNMHTTIVSMMHAHNQEEALGYRGRSYSSGSNSGRVRSVRSHYNNPPPSQIGMGKMSSISKRLRCESLPASYVGGLNDSRLRTGSEGENTMRRPLRVCSMRCPNGSISPGMRNRSWISHPRRLMVYYHPPSNISHSHTYSLPGSCNGSSAASSTEHLNTAVTSGSDYISSTASSAALQRPVSDSSSVQSVDDYAGGHSPNQGSLQRNNARGQKQYHGNGRSNTPEFHQSSLTLPIHEDAEVNRHYCVNCLAHIPTYFSRLQMSSGLAPPPPDVQPPSNPHGASSSHEYANVCSHVRNGSMDDSLTSEVGPSSLPESPQQNSLMELNMHLESSENQSKLNVDESGNQEYLKQADACNSPALPSPTEQLLSSGSSDPYLSFGDYTPMDLDNSQKYPHQKMSSDCQKTSDSPQNSIIAKLQSLTGVSSSSQSLNGSYSSSYTSMTSNSAEGKIQGKFPLAGYVPMRSLAARSLPQDIGCRRRSVPDTWYRFGGNQNRSSPPYGYSPEKSYESINRSHNFCSNCINRLSSQKTPIAEESGSPRLPQSSLLHDNLHSDASSKDISDLDKVGDTPKTVFTASNASSSPSFPVDNSPPVAASFNSTAVHEDDYLCMQSQQQQVKHASVGKRDCVKTEISSSRPAGRNSITSADMPFRDTEINGYLPMSPVIVSSILSIAENNTQVSTTPVQYPHQRKDRRGSSFSTNSLDRPKGFGRQKRPKSHGFRHTINSSTRRAQSMKQGRKTSNDSASSSQKNSLPSSTASSHPSLSPGGEYVNIDFTKALGQMQSPYLIDVTRSREVPCSPTMPLRQLGLNDSDYTEMSNNVLAGRCIQTNI